VTRLSTRAETGEDWFSDWVHSLAAQRLGNHRSDVPEEMQAIQLVRAEFLPRLARGRVTWRSAMLAWRDSLGGVLPRSSDGQVVFFATRFVHWMGGLTMGCCAGFDAWIATRPAVLMESETASQLTRIHCRGAGRKAEGAEERIAYGRFLARMGYALHDVAAIAQVTEGLIRDTSSPSTARIVACDRVWHFLGGYHEGAWMTLGLIRTSPRASTHSGSIA